MKIKLALLVLDYDLYPRQDVDSANVRSLVEALNAGVELPPIVIDKQSKRVVDGIHRVHSYRRVLDETATIEVIARNYASDAEMFLDAIQLNAGHGKRLSPFDKARAILRAEELKIEVDRIAGALHITIDRVGEIEIRKGARTNGQKIIIKNTLRHLAGGKLNKKQRVANDRAGGMFPLYYVNQVINIIEGDVLDRENEKLMERLGELRELLGAIL